MNNASDLRTFESHDGPLAYRDTGSGQPLVLLHAGFLDHTMWDDQIPALARHHRVIAPDARGHGWSANASGPFRQADDVAALLRHLAVGPAVLVGVSMGANIAVDTTVEHPGLVRALVVSGGGTTAGPGDPWTDALRAAQFAALGAGDIGGWLDTFTLSAAGPHRTPDDVHPHVVRRLREMAGRTLAKHTAGEPDFTVPVPDTATRVKEISVPVLALNGALDASDLIGMAEHVAGAATDGRVTAVEGAGHFPNMEQPDAFNQALEEFLRGL
ncbi:alpha/beta fold hydrolase [Streptomyces syringium]|uniref:alpha/beta fold hydrolase n=1 Tax=Streptomyces syringium TaxID=76729 RepID=UPI0034546F6B